MEEVAVACGASGAQHVILRDDGSLWISSRTLAVALEYSKARNLYNLFDGTAHAAVERSAFPAGLLAFPKDEKSHYFLRLSHLPVVLNKKYLERVCDIVSFVQMFFGRKLMAESQALERPRSRSSSGAPPTKVRRLLGPICDLPVPPETWVDPRPPPVDVEENGIAPKRLRFDHIEFSGAPSPAFPGRQAMPEPADRVLRPNIPKSLEFLESRAQHEETVVREREFDFELALYTHVVESSGRRIDPLEKRPLMRLEHAIQSKRSIEEVTICANGLSHDLLYTGVAGGAGGKFSWTVSLNTFGLVPALKSGLAFFEMVATVEIWSRGADKKREWCAQSEYIGIDEMRALLDALVFGPMPPSEVHVDFAGVLPTGFASLHSWVAESHGTSLSKDPPKLLPAGTDVVVVSRSSLAAIAQGRRCCSKSGGFSLSPGVGLEGSAEFTCAVCKSVNVIPLFAGDRSVLNHTAYVAQMMSGRPKAVSRFLELLSIGKIPHRSSGGTFIEMLWRATEPIYSECSKTIMEYCVLSDSVTISLDAFHKRMAKAFTVLGESFSTGVSIADPRIRKVLYVFFTERRDLDERRRGNEDSEIRFPSPVTGKEPLTTTLGGIEHASFDLAMQALRDLLADARTRITAKGDMLELEAELAIRLDNWELGSIVSDALSSASNSVKKTFPNVDHFIDWWHRRTSFKKEVQKAEAKKKEKKAQNPGFEGASVALGNVFSDCMFAKMPFDGFVAEVNRLLAGSNVDVRRDEAHVKAWDKLMAKAEKMYSQTSIDKGSGVNELFHAHLRFFCLKGDAMSTTHWKIVVSFAFLSFNNFPNWQKRVTDEFLKLWK
jgi:hypothetical protein